MSLAAAVGLALLTGCSGSPDSTAPSSSRSGTGAPSSSTLSTPGDSSPPSASSGSSTSSSSQAPVAISTVTGESTRLTLSGSFVDALKVIGLSVTAVDGATLDQSGGGTTFVFPISGGDVTTLPTGDDRFSGTVRHTGGLRLSGLGQSVTIGQLVLDGSSDQLTGEVAGRRLPLLPLETGPGQVSTSGSQVVLDEKAVALTPDSLTALAGQLHLPALPSATLGSLTSTITGA